MKTTRKHCARSRSGRLERIASMSGTGCAYYSDSGWGSCSSSASGDEGEYGSHSNRRGHST